MLECRKGVGRASDEQTERLEEGMTRMAVVKVAVVIDLVVARAVGRELPLSRDVSFKQRKQRWKSSGGGLGSESKLLGID
jgi:hypothetical protein